jgi:hypothetical protein
MRRIFGPHSLKKRPSAVWPTGALKREPILIEVEFIFYKGQCACAGVTGNGASVTAKALRFYEMREE